jgi:acyl dehydratase
LLKFNASGYKGKGAISTLPSFPRRKADYTFDAATYPNQAILYRLTGDKNPLHIDPKFASIQKLPKPIIHGMASKGIVTRTII